MREDAVSSLRLRHSDGTWRHVQSVHTNLLGDPDVRAVVVTTRDVTAQKQLEAQLQHNALPRRADRAGQPGAVRRPARARPGAHRPRRRAGGRALRRPRRLQGRQRRLRPRRRRRAARRRRRAAAAGAAPRRHRRPAGRRRVRRPHRGRRRRRPPRRPPPTGCWPPSPSRSRPTTRARRCASRPASGIATGAARPARRRRAAAARRRRHVRREGGRQGPVRGLRAGHGLRDHRPAAACRTELARAVEHGEFVVHYQPTWTWRPAGSPASRRWSAGSTPSAGWCPPLDFIPLAEQTGLIVPIGRVRAAGGLPADARLARRATPTGRR